MNLNSVIFDGNFKNMKAALSRSILGVTYKKFKRKRGDFYHHRIHNETTTEEMIRHLYFTLKNELPDLKDYKIKVNYAIEWDSNGKILSFNNITISVYLSVGNLYVSNLKIIEKILPIKIDLFYSNIDVASQSVMESIEEIIDNLGEKNYQYFKYDILSIEGKTEASNRHIEKVPTVIIHDEIILENPNKREINDAIHKISIPDIIIGDVKFDYELSTQENVQKLIKVLAK